jgi:hypothetical protein
MEQLQRLTVPLRISGRKTLNLTTPQLQFAFKHTFSIAEFEVIVAARCEQKNKSLQDADLIEIEDGSFQGLDLKSALYIRSETNNGWARAELPLWGYLGCNL